MISKTDVGLISTDIEERGTLTSGPLNEYYLWIDN